MQLEVVQDDALGGNGMTFHALALRPLDGAGYQAAFWGGTREQVPCQQLVINALLVAPVNRLWPANSNMAVLLCPQLAQQVFCDAERIRCDC